MKYEVYYLFPNHLKQINYVSSSSLKAYLAAHKLNRSLKKQHEKYAIIVECRREE